MGHSPSQGTHIAASEDTEVVYFGRETGVGVEGGDVGGGCRGGGGGEEKNDRGRLFGALQPKKERKKYQTRAEGSV